MFATPHSSAFDGDPENTRERYRLLCARFAQILPEVKLYLGCEVYCDAVRMPEVLSRLRTGQYPTMNGTKFVLIEFSRRVMPESTTPCVEALVRADYTPILAHMERYKYLRGNIDLVDRFRKRGAKIQINAYSLLEEQDASIRNWARRLVLDKKADFLGTDAHRTYHRPPCAERGLQWLYENVSLEYANAISWGNASRLLVR